MEKKELKVKENLEQEEVQKLLYEGKEITDNKIEESLNYDLLSEEGRKELLKSKIKRLI